MDCLQAAEIISAAADGELLDAEQLARAREHCVACAECRALVALMARIKGASEPRAPRQLLDRLDEIASTAAAAARERDPDEDTIAELLPALRALEPKKKRGWSRVTVFASAAAVVLVALTMGSILITARTGGGSDSTTTLMSEKGSAPAGAGETSTAQDLAASPAPDQAASSYVVFDRSVWVLEGGASPSVVTTAGVVASDLGAGAVAEHDAFLSASDGVLYVRGADGQYLSFRRVERTMGHARYRLVTDVPVTQFGQWPQLPSDIPAPAAADGSPVFMLFGFDDRNVDIYTRKPYGIEKGFAVAPGTAADDPAAGNPNWTWWEKL